MQPVSTQCDTLHKTLGNALEKGKSYGDISIYISSEINHCIHLHLLAAVSLSVPEYYWASCKEQRNTSCSLSHSRDESNTFPVPPPGCYPDQHTDTIYQPQPPCAGLLLHVVCTLGLVFVPYVRPAHHSVQLK